MSSAPSDIDRAAFFKGTVKFDSDEEALQALVEMKDMEFGDYFTSRDTDLNQENSGGISLTFYHDELSNHLSLESEPESEIEIRLHLVNEFVDAASEVLSKIVGEMDTITQQEVNAFKRYDIAFADLDTPIDQESDLEVTGINVVVEDSEVIVQSVEGEEWTAAQLRNSEEISYEGSVPDDVMSRYFEAVDSLVQGDLQ